jgi:DNA-binding NarL/FixJ family response regulator
VTIRVIVAEDALITRAGIVRLLERLDGVEVVGEAGDHDELLAAVDEHQPAVDPLVVITDIRMPPTHTDEGIRAAVELRDRHPGVGVVVLSQYVEPGWAVELLAAGSACRAYLLKERVAEPAELHEAIRRVAAGGSVVDPHVVEALIAAQTRQGPLAVLSPREREVLAEIATGRSNAAIAERLVLSQRAVEKHINSLFGKLGLGEQPEVHRRVTAVLLHLGHQPGT